MEILILFAGLFLTAIGYLVYPLIYMEKHGKVSAGEARRIALWNSIIVAAIFFIISAIAFEASLASANFAPAVIYYFIVKKMLTKNANEKTVDIDDDNQVENNQDENVQNNDSQNENKEI